MASTFSAGHPERLAEFQKGEDRFVWGRVSGGDQLWFLGEDTAHDNRGFVKAQVVCPVPGCDAPLTTAHYTTKRDHLRHLVGTGGHSRESILHSQGCALVESWLQDAYPRSTVRREEYTSPQGERRADVMLTGRRGDRIAFEVQYSALTPDDWRTRHESYRAQGIVDVWLFGHTGKQLNLDRDGFLLPNPTHDKVVETGAPLLFINPDPDQGAIAIAIGRDAQFDADLDDYRDEDVDVTYVLSRARLEVRPLSEFRADLTRGLTSDLLDGLCRQSLWLPANNRSEKARAAEIRERQRLQKEVRQKNWESLRAPQQGRIRELLGEEGRWSKSQALAAIKSYFGDYLGDRIDPIRDPFAVGLPVRWQCVLYFEMIAGNSEPFDTRTAYRRVKTRGFRFDEKNAFKETSSYLYRLEERGFLRIAPGLRRYPMFKPTISGAWW